MEISSDVIMDKMAARIGQLEKQAIINEALAEQLASLVDQKDARIRELEEAAA